MEEYIEDADDAPEVEWHVDVIPDIASDFGISEDEVYDAVDDDQLESEMEQRFAEAKQRGVSGIPTFAYDGHAARGAIPPHQFERLVDGV